MTFAMISKQLKAYFRQQTERYLPNLIARRDRHALEAMCRQVNDILKSEEPPQHSPSENDFDKLMSQYTSPPEYGYDPVSIWKRAYCRAETLLSISEYHPPGMRLLEAGCGDGMVGRILGLYGHHITLMDMEDWRDPRAKDCTMVVQPLETAFPEQCHGMDMIYSYNTMEHVKDPACVFEQMWSCLKPGGILHLDFGPIYPSAYGMHAYRMLPMPYPQYLFSEPFIRRKLAESTIVDLGGEKNALQPMNRWRCSQFCALWERPDCLCLKQAFRRDRTALPLVLGYPQAFTGRRLTLEDLTTHAIIVTLKKAEPSSLSSEKTKS